MYDLYLSVLNIWMPIIEIIIFTIIKWKKFMHSGLRSIAPKNRTKMIVRAVSIMISDDKIIRFGFMAILTNYNYTIVWCIIKHFFI